MDPFLMPNAFVDSDHPAVIAFAEAHAPGLSGVDAAVALYLAIRDGWRYNPWRVRFTRADYTASGVVLRDRAEGGHCIDKALLLAATCRVKGIPSKLHFADVRNHIGTAKLEQKLGTDLLVFHGYAELYLDGRWVAATPAFNKELCAMLGVEPLEFDGRNDSIFQEYDPVAGRFMEYVADHGSHADIPFERMIAAWKVHYEPLARDGRWPTP
ncbi:MAG: transglutaminase family protein [Myxococcota bacterium]